MGKPDHILSERFGDKRIFLDLKSQNYLSLNPTATLIWEGLEAGLSHSQIAQTIGERFEVEREDLADDIVAFEKELRARGLLIEADSR